MAAFCAVYRELLKSTNRLFALTIPNVIDTGIISKYIRVFSFVVRFSRSCTQITVKLNAVAIV
jgi:hypothetical protein